MKKTRLDTLLVEQGYFPDADAALRAVLAHEVKVDDVYATSAALKVAPDAEIRVRGRRRFVSRGGHKLQGALDAYGQDVSGLRCIDIGSSTGGFTDCLLQAGAASVACVDVNYGQLAWRLRQDGRVAVFERTNIKLADPAALGAPFDVLVADLSFIGLAQLAPVFARLSREGSVFLGLVKPQFESRPGEAEGVNYYYMTNAQFEEKLARGEILEHVNYCGKYYGTPKSEVDRRIAAGTTVVLVIEVVGAANIKRMYPESTLVFILPPSMEELAARLRGRGTEDEAAVQKRLARAEEELREKDAYDFAIVNDDARRCADELYEILRARQSE